MVSGIGAGYLQLVHLEGWTWEFVDLDPGKLLLFPEVTVITLWLDDFVILFKLLFFLKDGTSSVQCRAKIKFIKFREESPQNWRTQDIVEEQKEDHFCPSGPQTAPSNTSPNLANCWRTRRTLQKNNNYLTVPLRPWSTLKLNIFHLIADFWELSVENRPKCLCVFLNSLFANKNLRPFLIILLLFFYLTFNQNLFCLFKLLDSFDTTFCLEPDTLLTQPFYE